MTGETLRPPVRSPGRPRSEAARRAILSATAVLVAEESYAGTTVDGIAARAGVGKQTIYRWWPTKADVVLEACSSETQFLVPTTDHGSYDADLRAFLRTAYAMASREPTAELLRALMTEAQTSTAFGERFRALFLRPRRDALMALIARADERGDLPTRLQPDTVADIVFGTLWYRLLATHAPLDDQAAEDLVAALS